VDRTEHSAKIEGVKRRDVWKARDATVCMTVDLRVEFWISEDWRK
jgi:hypothetical protein